MLGKGKHVFWLLAPWLLILAVWYAVRASGLVNPALVPGMAIVFSVDKFMSEVRALTNITGNGIATVVVSWWEGELDRDKLDAALRQNVDTSDMETAITTG